MRNTPPRRIAYFMGTHGDWGGASRAMLNFIRTIDHARFQPVVILTSQGDLSRSLSEEGVEWIEWGIHDRTANLGRYALSIISSSNLLRKKRIDLVHMNYGSIGWKPAEILAARLIGLPVINHFHTPVHVPTSYIKYTQACVCVSRFIADHLDSFGVPKHAIHNISDLARFSHGNDIRVEIGLSEHHVVVMLAGQMIRAKGIEMFVEAARRIRGEHVRFVLAGSFRNTEGAYTEAEIDSLCARDPRIRYIGFRRDAENLYATADIMTMPSQWEEPCAMILFESAAAGKPVVASATGGTPEIIRHGETGYLFDRDDIETYVSQLQSLIDDEDLRKRLGTEAARVARTEFATGPTKKMEALYDSLVGKD